MENKKRYILIAIIMMILVISVSTYAWLSYRSKETAMVLTIGEVGSISIRLQPYKFSSSIDPTITYEGNDYVNVTASNQSDKAYNIKLYYKINDIPDELIDENFKYTILRSSDGENYSEYDEGNFSNAESGSEYVILDEEKLMMETEYLYRVYLWIEGSVSDNTDMQGKVFDAELRADYEETTGIEILTYSKLSSNYLCANNSVGSEPIFTYTGDCEVVDDGDGNWKIKFLTSGTFVSSVDLEIDVFLVGGGGGGYRNNIGGGGGYTLTKKAINILIDTEYQIVVGSGGNGGKDGESSEAFDLVVKGGGGGYIENHTNYTSYVGGSGGSGGGVNGYDGGVDGSGGLGFSEPAGILWSNGYGQGYTTREFEEPDAFIYSNGGGKTDSRGNNTGDGGRQNGYSGNSGIVIIRNAQKSDIMINSTKIGKYTGNYEVINDSNGNWKVKFLTSGTFVSSVDLEIDVFLVGGGGGGYRNNIGGGGGYTLTKKAINILIDTEYQIVVGSGGNRGNAGGSSKAFDLVAKGGGGGYIGNHTYYTSYVGGSGGSGGGVNGYAGGVDGSDGLGFSEPAGILWSNGAGQGHTTREFEEPDAFIYSNGGGKTDSRGNNTGDGGRQNGYSGNSGIVIIRNAG